MKISLAKNQFAAKWRNADWSESELRARLRKDLLFTVTRAQYVKLSKNQQAEMKGSAGAYLLGECAGGVRKSDTINVRSALVLDLDCPGTDFWRTLKPKLGGLSWIMHSTAGHTPEAPRYRLIVFLSRDLKPDEWEATERMFAKEYGLLPVIDPVSFRVNQPMFFPSHPSDSEYICEEGGGAPLDPDEYLAKYADRRDITTWPTAPGESEIVAREIKKQEDPLTKSGVVGAFCRAYSCRDALETFLPGVYEPTASDDRYTFVSGESSGGLVLYDGGKFAYSHHATDPASGKLCNAFDLVRVHKFGDTDEKASFRAMSDFAVRDERVSATLLADKKESARTDFQGDADWAKKLQRDKKGNIENTLRNITLILENDDALKSVVFNQLADGMEINGAVPWAHPARFWRDADDAQLISYVDSHYGTFSARNYEIAVAKVADDRSYHPIREYLGGLPPWDRIPRADTILITYLGAEDNEYVRAVTRKTLCAAVARVQNPGVKFDSMPVLSGPQGIGKSTLIAKLGGEWFSDSLSLSDTKDKTAAEKLQGYWILEIGELAGLKKAEVETLRSFLTRQNDIYRASFGRRVTPHPRQCIFFGTTNAEKGYLRDVTGNRRFWPVKTPGGGERQSWQLTKDEVDQIWAEVLTYVAAGEKLYLDPSLERLAKDEQREAMETDEREGVVRDYLERLLPENWDKMSIYDRRSFISDPDDPTLPSGVKRRETVSNMEIWCECFGKDRANLKRMEGNEISAIMARIGGWSGLVRQVRLPIYGPQWVHVTTECNEQGASVQ